MPCRRRFPAACLLALFAVAGLAAAQSSIEDIPVSQDYVPRTWDVEDGLPNNNVESIAQTPDGYLWIATWSGIGRFDGTRFTTFSKGSGLDTNEVNVLLAARGGALWAGFRDGGLARFRQGTFRQILPGKPSTENSPNVHSLAEDAEGAIWVGFFPTPKVVRWTPRAITEFTPREGVGPGSFPMVEASTDGTIWLATSEGCGFFDGKRFQPFPANDGGDVRIGAARAGGMWVARGHQLFHYWKNGGREVVADLAWLGGSQPVNLLFEDRAGNLWIGMRNSGLIRYREGRFERVPTPSSSIAAICEDREDNLWVGTRGGGLLRLSPRGIFLRKAKADFQRVRDDTTSSVCVDAGHRVALAQGGALVRAVDSTNRVFAPAPVPDPNMTVFTLHPDPSGGIWLGGLSSILRCWKDGIYRIDDFFPGSIVSLVIDRRDALWIASSRGLYRRTPDGAVSRIDVPGLADPLALAVDSEGRVWAGTKSGSVFRQDGETFRPAPLPGAKPGQQIEFLVPDDRDTLWLGAFEGGLYRWKAGRFDRLPPDAGLPSGDLKSLEIAPNGSFWFATDRGLYRVERGDLEDVLDGRKPTLRAAAFGRNDGLPTLNFFYGFLHASARTPDGHVWFATTSGALEIDPDRLRKTTPPNPVLIEDFQVGGVSLPGGNVPGKPAGGIVLPPRPGAIQIRYTLPQMSAPEQLRFRYRLLGSGDESWYAAENQRTSVFTNLAPGAYTFEVAAAEPSGPWLPGAATASFTIRAAWWETIWFRLAAALVGAIALAALVRAIVHRRMQARIRRLEQEGALERERSRIARDMHDELGARLTHIMLMSELAATEPGPADNLQKIAQTARTVSSTLDEIVWTTNPRNDTLEHLVGYIAEFAGEYLAPTGIDLRLELPSEIPSRIVSSEKRHNVLLVVKEALNNIVKHAGARHVHLRVALERGRLQVAIADDGRGFDPATVAATANGLANMRQRLAAISGSIVIESEPGRGTTVTLEAKV